MISARKLIASFCLVAVALAALTPGSTSLFSALLIPLMFFVGTITIVWAEPRPDEKRIPTASCSCVIASRAPPIADPL